MGGSAFEVHRGLITQSAVEPFWVIEGFDVIEDGRAGRLMGREVVVVQPFGFESAPERFHGGIVVAVSRSAHAWMQAAGTQQRPVGAAGILASPVGMVEEPGGGTAINECLLQ